MTLQKKEILSGITATLALLSIYFIIMAIGTRSWSATISQFEDLWYWIMILATGFGIQIVLFTHLQNRIKQYHTDNKSKIIAATSTGTSTVAMVACCAHHVTEILPIIGLSGAAIFLTQYQVSLIIVGIFMNIVGIVYMLRVIVKLS